MKRLIIMRHCKSDWSTVASSDHDRPLNARGQRSAVDLGNWLRAQNLLPDTVLCSDSARTVETADRLGLPDTTNMVVTRDLYLAEPEKMLRILHKAHGDTVLMVAHNPGSAALAASLAKGWPDHPDFPRYPTGATLVLDFDIADWAQVQTDSGTVNTFTVPRDLV